MIHFLPEPDAIAVAPPGDALARVAGLAHALAAAWPSATNAQHALFDALSAHAVAGSVAGLEAIGALRDAGLEANRAAIDTLTASIRGELDRLGTLLTL